MKLRKKLIPFLVLTACLVLFCSMPVFAAELTEADVEAAVASQGKEAVTGNVFVWFLCAIAFLKVSQKIDSFLASLGINVGNTGGNMMAEPLIAGRSLTVPCVPMAVAATAKPLLTEVRLSQEASYPAGLPERWEDRYKGKRLIPQPVIPNTAVSETCSTSHP